MKYGAQLVSGTLLVAFFTLRCTELENANDWFPASDSAGASSGAGGVLATGGTTAGETATAGTSALNGGSAGGLPGGAGGDSSLGGSAGGAGEPEPGAGAGGDGGADGDCIDPTGFDGLGCYACVPNDMFTLENACTDALCTPFDNTRRLVKILPSGELPSLPDAPGSGGTSGSGGMSGSSGGAGSGGSGGAGVSCQELVGSGTAVHITGSSAVKPFLQQIAQQLAGEGIYVVYTSTGSCVGVDAVVNGTLMTTGSSPAPAATALVWENSASTGRACDLPAAGVPADLGISDVFAETCPGFELTNLDGLRVRDAHGPIQTMAFAVPTNSPHREISAQAAYFVFGFGADGGVLDASGSDAIWHDESLIFQRSASSGTQAMLASAIGVPPARWRGKLHKTSDDVAAALQAAASDEASARQAIGILAADYIDTKNLRAQIRTLAYQDSRQSCAVLPDSTPSARDKQNVRDGHYPIWGPLHLLYKLDRSGNPLNEQNRQALTDIVGYLSGTKPLPNGVKLLDVYAQSGLIPECAMRVTRTSDGRAITPYRPPNPCSCVFEAKATGSTTCRPCRVQGDCSADEGCSQGYCEK
jgi:ABC-type phosphate transport system substrate-binding protein